MEWNRRKLLNWNDDAFDSHLNTHQWIHPTGFVEEVRENLNERKKKRWWLALTLATKSSWWLRVVALIHQYMFLVTLYSMPFYAACRAPTYIHLCNVFTKKPKNVEKKTAKETNIIYYSLCFAHKLRAFFSLPNTERTESEREREKKIL